MDKHNKYKFVFESAKKFLDEIIAKHPNLDSSILEKHLQQESKFDNILDAHRRLIESLSNRNMMASVIVPGSRGQTLNVECNYFLSSPKNS
ncbi:MAG: hypothetical protein ABIG69_18780 [Bacteroidota bacterium]